VIGRGRDLSQMRDVLRLTVRGAQAVRLDQYIISALNWKSRTRVQELIHAGSILVNGGSTKPSRRVKEGDEVTVRLSHGTGRPANYGALTLDIVYEDPWLLALNKPPGLLVHPVGRHVYDTLINYLHHRYRDAVGEDGDPVRPRLCHRLDRDTTGLLVVGKEAHTHRDVQAQFERRLVRKEYTTLVLGDYPANQETLDAPLGEGRSLETCLEHEVLKVSRTTVRVVKRFGDFTLLSCLPHTGRQNQIRVHLAASGFPVVGDERYGRGPPPPGFPPRYLLHSEALSFHHPRLKSWMELTAPVPDDFRKVVDLLG